MKRSVVVIVGYVPDQFLDEFVQQARTFDATHENCHFKIVVSTDRQLDEIIQALDEINPPFDVRQVFRKQ